MRETIRVDRERGKKGGREGGRDGSSGKTREERKEEGGRERHGTERGSVTHNPKTTKPHPQCIH